MSVLLLLFSLLISCSTTPIRQDQVDAGTWEARVLIKDKRNAKSYLVNVDFAARKSTNLRMDVTTPLGIHVTTFALNQKKATYVVPQKKAYYSGPSSASAFKPVMDLNLDPKLLLHVLFDIPINGSGWKCLRDAKGYLASCERSSDQFRIIWSDRKGREKTVNVTHREFELQMKFHSFKSKSDFKDGFFDIKQPEGFRKI